MGKLANHSSWIYGLKTLRIRCKHTYNLESEARLLSTVLCTCDDSADDDRLEMHRTTFGISIDIIIDDFIAAQRFVKLVYAFCLRVQVSLMGKVPNLVLSKAEDGKSKAAVIRRLIINSIRAKEKTSYLELITCRVKRPLILSLGAAATPLPVVISLLPLLPPLLV
uniref:Uncharacterized protein n=1 Tax=Glossina palpalis gambiensis TaxID=67801 RepID=A0A1B0C2E3_9MUSC